MDDAPQTQSKLLPTSVEGIDGCHHVSAVAFSARIWRFKNLAILFTDLAVLFKDLAAKCYFGQAATWSSTSHSRLRRQRL